MKLWLTHRYVVVTAAATGAALTLAGHRVLGARLVPDTALYAQGGLGWFPSPLGRLAGLTGIGQLAVTSAIATAAVCLLSGVIADRRGGSGDLAAWLALMPPTLFWFLFPGVDALAVAFVLAATLSTRARWPLALLACASHAAIVPVVALLSYRWAGRDRFFIVTMALVLGSVFWIRSTPYAIDGAAVLSSTAIASAIVTVVYGAWLAILRWRRVLDNERQELLAVAFGVGIAVLLVQGDDPGTVARYAMPLTAFAAIAVGTSRRTSLEVPS